MSDSMFGSLLNSLDKGTIGQVAQSLGQPEQSVARGMETSIASLLGGLASKSEDTGALRRILDTVSGASEPISWSQLASGVTDPNSPILSMGKRILPALFGSSERTVTGAIGRESGLPSGAITTLLTMAAPVVMSFISKQVRDSGMTMSSLGALLQRESATIRSALVSFLEPYFACWSVGCHERRNAVVSMVRTCGELILLVHSRARPTDRGMGMASRAIV